jgi:glutamyl-tRNA reductase
VAISAENINDSLSLLHSYVPHGVILSTCNRTEIYTTDNGDYHAEKASLDFMKAWANVPDDRLLQHIFVHKDREVVEHLFRVASGLESMMIGEFEVLGQARQSLEIAEESGMVNLPLRNVFQSAVRTGRRVRNETGISNNALSVSSVAVDLAADIVGSLRRCRMLVIGVGEAGTLVAKVAKKRGVSQIVIANRTKERAQELAATLDGIPIGLNDLSDEIRSANIIITCAGAPHRILDVRHLQEAMKNRPESPMAIIDIAIPRNVAPEVGEIQNVFLYNIDDLTEISNLTRQEREGEVRHAEGIITDEVNKFAAWWQVLAVRPLVSALMSKAEEIRSAQLNRTLKNLPPLSREEREILEAMTKSIVSKILENPVQYLKSNGNGNHTQMIKELFQLNF